MAQNVKITETDIKKIVHCTVEKVLREWSALDEMAYPVTFNIEQFKKLPSFAARIRYCQDKLQRIASGSSRIVYKIDNEKVLKLAKNRKGIAQNQNETDYYLQQIGCFAKIYDFDDENYLWVEMQLARKAKPSDFQKITGYKFDVICAWIDYCRQSYTPGNFYRNRLYDELFKSKDFQDNYEYSIFYMLQDYLGNYALRNTGDLQRISSWGVVSNNGQEQLVLVDFGLTDDTYNQYYNR